MWNLFRSKPFEATFPSSDLLQIDHWLYSFPWPFLCASWVAKNESPESSHSISNFVPAVKCYFLIFSRVLPPQGATNGLMLQCASVCPSGDPTPWEHDFWAAYAILRNFCFGKKNVHTANATCLWFDISLQASWENGRRSGHHLLPAERPEGVWKFSSTVASADLLLQLLRGLGTRNYLWVDMCDFFHKPCNFARCPGTSCIWMHGQITSRKEHCVYISKISGVLKIPFNSTFSLGCFWSASSVCTDILRLAEE